MPLTRSDLVLDIFCNREAGGLNFSGIVGMLVKSPDGNMPSIADQGN